MRAMRAKFQSARVPQVVFGAGTITELPTMVKSRGFSRIGIVTGATWLPESENWHMLLRGFGDRGCRVTHRTTSGEPSPGRVDEIAEAFQHDEVGLVLGIGGGSVLDTAKAAAVAAVVEGSIEHYVEGVGTRQPDGTTLPMIAVPTSAGTGSEATKNAVLSETGEGGFKKSLRHENFIPTLALIDPELGVSASPEVSAASGLDAVTQLLEAYISTNASIFTDSLAETGLSLAGRSFTTVVQDGEDLPARGDMAYAAFLSGVCLANAGLGIVHGAASPAGATTGIPHGVFCGNLLLPAIRSTVQRLAQLGETSGNAAWKLRRAAALLRPDESRGDESEREMGTMEELVERLEEFLTISPLLRLSAYGLTEAQLDRIAERTGLKNHPVAFSQGDVRDMLLERL